MIPSSVTAIVVAAAVVVAGAINVAAEPRVEFAPEDSDQTLLTFRDCNADERRTTDGDDGFVGPCFAADLDVDGLMGKVGFHRDEVDDGEVEENLYVAVKMDLDQGRTITKTFTITTYWRRQGENVFGPTVSKSPCLISPENKPDDAVAYHCFVSPEVASASMTDKIESAILFFRTKSTTSLSVTTTARMGGRRGFEHKKSETVLAQVKEVDSTDETSSASTNTSEIIKDLSLYDEIGGDLTEDDDGDSGDENLDDLDENEAKNSTNGTDARGGEVISSNDTKPRGRNAFVGWRQYGTGKAAGDRIMVVSLVCIFAVIVVAVIIFVIINRTRKIKKKEEAEEAAVDPNGAVAATGDEAAAAAVEVSAAVGVEVEQSSTARNIDAAS